MTRKDWRCVKKLNNVNWISLDVYKACEKVQQMWRSTRGVYAFILFILGNISSYFSFFLI